MGPFQEHVKHGPQQADLVLLAPHPTGPGGGLLVGLIDDREEYVGEDEDEEDVEGEEVEDRDHRARLVELVEVELPQSHLEIHAQGTPQGVVAVEVRPEGQVGHTHEAEDEHHEDQDEVEGVFSCTVDCC